MRGVTLQQIGPMIREQRGERGIREVAKEVGVSAATLSRVERGKLPDLETFSRVCRWLKLNPGDVLGFSRESQNALVGRPKPSPSVLQAHFRAERNLSPKAAAALAEMILAAQELLAERFR